MSEIGEVQGESLKHTNYRNRGLKIAEEILYLWQVTLLEKQKNQGSLKLVIGLNYWYSKKERIDGQSTGHVIKGALQF